VPYPKASSLLQHREVIESSYEGTFERRGNCFQKTLSGSKKSRLERLLLVSPARKCVEIGGRIPQVGDSVIARALQLPFLTVVKVREESCRPSDRVSSHSFHDDDVYANVLLSRANNWCH